MSGNRCSHLRRFAVLATGALLLLGSPVLGQTVSVFDDAPSIEQLRSIMIPESGFGMSRSIVIQRPSIDPVSGPVQQVSTEDQAAPRPPTARARPPVVQAAAKVPAGHSDGEPGAVAFHVNFAFNSAALPASADEMIGLIAQLMKETPEIRVRVEGHTDGVGSPSYNLTLSERRALSVGEYLVRQGVDPSRLEVVGKGMSEPLTPNKYDPANRRVQFVRIG
jgi:outer membrane protein OmpA-like peptidoglycan-associated protein